MAFGYGLAGLEAARVGLAEAMLGLALPRLLDWARWFAPDNPQVWVARAEVDPAHAVAALEQALQRRPADASLRIRLALALEQEGRTKEAEDQLIQATKQDRGHVPRWALANFYFRLQDTPNFWRWAREAARTAPDAAGVYRLCWQLTSDARWLMRAIVPPDPRRHAEFFWFLVRVGDLEAAGTVFEDVLAWRHSGHVPLLVAYCNRLLELGRIRDALQDWNRLVATGMIRRDRLDPQVGLIITNGEFSECPLGSGFDWRIRESQGLGIHWVPGEVRIQAMRTGTRAHRPLVQWTPLRPGCNYQIDYEYVAAGGKWRWVLLDPRTNRVWAHSSDFLVSARLEHGHFRFSAPDVQALMLALEWEPGEGEFEVSSLRLRRVVSRLADPVGGNR